MTAQRGDIYKHKRSQYSIVAMSEPMIFNPKDYGMEPHMSSTACYRGYWCEYDIREDGLYLQNLYLFNRDGNYPEFNGISVAPVEYEEYNVYTGNSRKPKRQKFPKYDKHRLYKDVNLRIPYTGKILTGKDFLRDYYIHMGYQRPFAYKVLKEFVFTDGNLTAVIDHSAVAEKLRESIDLNDPMWELGTVGIPQFVEDSFSLDYKTKAWWLK